MNLVLIPPLSMGKTIAAIKVAQDTWNSGNVNEITALFCQNCEWRDNHRHIKGRDAIKVFLTNKKKEERNYSVKTELWSYSTFRIAVSFYSEWQHSLKNIWYRSSGHIFINLNKQGLINEFCLTSYDRAIQVKSRSVGFNR